MNGFVSIIGNHSCCYSTHFWNINSVSRRRLLLPGLHSNHKRRMLCVGNTTSGSTCDNRHYRRQKYNGKIFCNGNGYHFYQQQQHRGRQEQQVRNYSSSSSATAETAPSSSSKKNDIKIVEVGPRDGLQNEAAIVSTKDKVTLVNKLLEAGCSHVEVGSFVSPKWVPAMADSSKVVAELGKQHKQHSEAKSLPSSAATTFSCLVPNPRGLEEVFRINDEFLLQNDSLLIDEIAIFLSASEAFSRKNLNCTIAESLERYQTVVDTAKEKNNTENNLKKPLRVRAYVSCVLGCPYDGFIEPQQVARVLEQMDTILDACHEISLGDTIGVGTPASTKRMLEAVRQAVGDTTDCELAVHFHDTYGQALANIYAAIEQGITVIDSSIAGLGGCPYAGKGASGNVATEDVVYMLNGMGLTTGIDLEKLLDAGEFICHRVLQRETQSKAGKALMAKRERENASYSK